ncbi:MAG TPA: PAS domain S-box protein [Syntrophales bacterium]|nr:PAS domain S-box protein [Syntrophales bacterium]
MTGDPEIARKAGRYTSEAESYGLLRKYLLGLLTPFAAYSILEKFASTVTRSSSLKIRKLSSNSIEVRAVPFPGIEEKNYQCRNRMGILESVPNIFLNKKADIEHPECIHRGGDLCRYILSWHEPLSSKWRRVRNLTAPLGLILVTVSFIFFPSWGLPALTAFLFAFLLFSLAKEMTEKNEWLSSIEAQSDAAEQLIEQMNERYNEIQLIREIGQSAAFVLPVNDLLKLVTKALGRYLSFDRVLILLADRRGGLEFVEGHGLDPGRDGQLRRIQFTLEGPEGQCSLSRAFNGQLPKLLDSTAADCSERDREFAALAGTAAFICIPIVFGKESLGVMIASRSGSGKFAQSDISLLMGIAPQVASNIHLSLAYRKVRESEERFRSLSESAPDIIYMTDRQGNFTYVNPAWERILGHLREDVIGRNFTEFVSKDAIPEYMRNFKKARDGRKTVMDLTGTMIHKDGTPRYFSLSGGPNLNDDGDVIGVVGIFRDITESYELQKKLLQAQKLEALGTLAGGIAHDFNNLLMGIQGCASLMLRGIEPGHPHLEKLRSIEEQVRSGASLTKQMLGFARGGGYEMIPTDLKEIVEKSLAMFGRTKKQITINHKYADDIWTVTADRGQMEQVFLNLYVNAGQAMPDGGELYVSLENKILKEQEAKLHGAVPGRFVLITVKDTGTGMDKEIIDRIFEPFFTTKEKGRGTGLGLAMVYGIVKGHGGFIAVESLKGRGSTFSMYLPATGEKVQTGMQTEEVSISGQGTILLVDDEAAVLEVERGMLESLGYTVKCAKNGMEAIRLYREAGREIDLIMMDVIMPGLGGIEVLKEIRKMKPGARAMLASGYSVDSEISGLIRAEAAAFIQKPFSISELSRKIREVLDRVPQKVMPSP